ncbi:MAG: SDR family oxidoreductase [Erysipelotrichaceae bacterium]|nr:SDR family oxidoreductase [Erysipelotrichaceae bacterium]
MINVKGKWALITGASRGIGHLAALFLAERGCNLILHGRTEEHLEKTLTEVQEKGVKVCSMACELSDLTAVDDMLKRIDEQNVTVDFVLNNAGVQIAYRNDYLITPASDYEISFRITTIAPMMITYHFLEKMAERGFGRIVNTTSGIRKEPQQAGYSASKAALDKVTMDLASVYDGTDVMISLTDPGWCRTDLGGKNAPNSPESALPGVVLGIFMDDRKSGRCFSAVDFHGMSLEEAVNFAEENVPPYHGSLD